MFSATLAGEAENCQTTFAKNFNWKYDPVPVRV